MKKDRKKDFTKLTQKRGISLIVLIVTIIVIIILAAVVILTISKNNPVESAKEAKFKEDVRSFQDDLALTISKEYTDKQGQRDTKINATGYSKDTSNEEKYNKSIYKYIPSFTKEYEGKLIIKNDELVYQETVTDTEAKWLTDLGIKGNLKTAAQKVSENPADYYGQYITNYTTGNDSTVNAVSKWQIFHSDGNNIYLIADDYISYQYVPNGKNGSAIYINSTDYMLSFNDVISDYTGSTEVVLNSKAKSWISWVDIYNESKNNNIKAVSYMLDTNIWSTFANSNYAEYAIGGPTLEMFVESYNKTHETKLGCEEMDPSGYKVKIGDGSYSISTSGLPTNREMNSLYVIRDQSKAYAMWLASPFAENTSYVGGVGFSGYVYYHDYRDDHQGFRPLVCLKPDITLKAVKGGYEIQ